MSHHDVYVVKNTRERERERVVVVKKTLVTDTPQGIEADARPREGKE